MNTMRVNQPVKYYAVAVLATLSHPSYILMYAPWDVFVLPPCYNVNYLG
ncbi:hypothetical protein [Providencia huaxiensis]|nr:hypothetical protein [Providencia huaxiensis]